MRIIHCTQKLLKEMRNPPLESIKDKAYSEGLGNWYANLIRIYRKKCILFTNEKSIYSFLVPNVVKEHMRNFNAIFLAHLCLNLQHEGFGLEVINKIREEYKEIAYAKTQSRTVLGFMNDFAFQYEVHMQSVEGIENIRLIEINSRINRIPMHASKRNSFFPIKVMRGMIAEIM